MHRPGFDVIPNDRQPGIPEFCTPNLIRSEEHGNAIDHGNTRFKAGLRIILDRAFRADWEITHEHLGARRLQRSGNVCRFKINDSEGIVIRIVAHVRRDPVEDWACLDNHV